MTEMKPEGNCVAQRGPKSNMVLEWLNENNQHGWAGSYVTLKRPGVTCYVTFDT